DRQVTLSLQRVADGDVPWWTSSSSSSVVVLITIGDTAVQLRPVVDERAQGAQPRFISSPARDGGAIDRLTGLPLAGGLHSPRIAFGTQARVVPRQAAGRYDPPDDWFGGAGQVLITDLDEAIRRQHAPPMVHEPLVAAEIRNQFGASGRKR